MGTPRIPTGGAEPATAGPARILIVDDEPANALAVSAVLEDLGCELVVAHSGVDALKALLLHDDVVVIVMDIQMPGMDGWETTARIKERERTREIPVVFVTALGTDHEHLARAAEAGAAGYLGKPVEPVTLRTTISSLITE
ncbi:response regulator [Streptomyces otsuchiensis]|uniref:response regulator n=1 Tax=Streptomyces otsuchiensis TaxID=2681388 RepID=UPI0013003E4E|nr:response regulator [Streptomyces otsuchiensis]